MKKILMGNLIVSGVILANQLSYIPLNKANLANENGGDKSAIEAYSDGVGIYTVGKFQIDNSAMNELVFKHGEEASKNGETLKEFVLNNGNSLEKDFAEQLGNLAENKIPEDGTNCDDGNIQTINDIYINGTCKGDDLEGTTCNDYDKNTIFDSFINGICTGIFVSLNNLKNNGFILHAENKNSFNNTGYSLTNINNLKKGIIALDQNNNYILINKETFDKYLKNNNFDHNDAWVLNGDLGISFGNHNGGGRYNWALKNNVEPLEEISNMNNNYLTSRSSDGNISISILSF